MKFYYIAKRKRRGYKESYVGDGIIEARSQREARQLVAFMYKSPASRVKLTERN